MDDSDIYVTKKELYAVASNICVLTLFAVLLANREGFGRIYVGIWALVSQLYFTYKLLKTKRESSTVDI